MNVNNQADSFIDRETGKYELTTTRFGAVAVINDLHKGRDSGKAWSWIIDISAVLMTLVSISGIILICFIKKKRLSGFIIAAVGTIACYLIYKLFVP
ncbi:PepSY-associated TM helix domain-containing protein [Pedobacter borealis]|uniref:PepSY-associated TM helix domain-containing protein n=1 Tax=Pedobacter borealis TaxID=475254 RepID=UPI0009FAA081|nr:PepSY-associated TM helix domain-containing protein [Pedobacter borealis]